MPAQLETPTPNPRVACKVAATRWEFWGTKILSTAMGEATSDFLVYTISPYLAVALGTGGFLAAMVLQFRTKRYSRWKYWLAVDMVSIFGTMIAGIMHVVLGIPYFGSVVLFAALVSGTLVMWHRTESTLDIHAITTPRREAFYWATVILTFSLGTALGDMAAATLRLGFLGAGLAFSLLILMPALLYRYSRLNRVVLFWWAYILTRPLGASFADWFGFTRANGGIGIGHGTVSLVTTVLMLGLVVVMSRTKGDLQLLQHAE